MNTSPDPGGLIREYLRDHVPEIANGIVEIMSTARELGFRSMVAVRSHNGAVDPVGACAGIRGARLKEFHIKFPGEFIDIIRWEESPKKFILNALAPLSGYAAGEKVELDKEHNACLTLAPAAYQNLSDKDRRKAMLTSKLVGWDIKFTSA